MTSSSLLCVAPAPSPSSRLSARGACMASVNERKGQWAAVVTALPGPPHLMHCCHRAPCWQQPRTPPPLSLRMLSGAPCQCLCLARTLPTGTLAAGPAAADQHAQGGGVRGPGRCMCTKEDSFLRDPCPLGLHLLHCQGGQPRGVMTVLTGWLAAVLRSCK